MENLLIDSLDFFIIEKVYNSQKRKKGITSTWQIAKDYLNPNLQRKENRRSLEQFHIKVKRRLNKMSKWGIIVIEKYSNGNPYSCKNCYNLIKEKVKIGKHMFDGKYYNAVCLNLNNNWCAFQV